MKQKKMAWIAVVLALAGAGAWYLAQDGGKYHADATQAGGKGGGAQPPTVVNVVAPQRRDVPVMIQATGSVTPASSVDLHPQTTSTIRKVHIREGQFVKAGELMFTLDDRSDRANVDQAQAQVARDQAALADLERQHKRSTELFAQKFIAQSAVDTLRSQVESARALVASSQAALQAGKVSASYTSIRAPMAGRVGAIAVYPGSLVQPATSLAVVTQIDPIDVAFTLPEAALPDLMAAQGRGKVAVEASVAPGAPAHTGELSFIDNAVDREAGVIRVKARFANKDNGLWPGQYVNARITVRTLKDAVVVPQAAIIINAKGTFVYVVDPDQSARLVPVARVLGQGLDAVVTGLAGTEKVITEGKQNLRPGGKIKLAEPAEGKQGGGKGKKDRSA